MSQPEAELRTRFSAIVKDNGADVLGYLARRTDQPADAADAFGDVLAIAWEKASRMPVDENGARRWLFVIARNVLSNLHRGHRRRHSHELPASPEIAAAIRHDDDALDVRDAVKHLPPKYREIVMLVHWDGFTLVDAAALCSIRPSTARTRYARARDQLRTLLVPLSEGTTNHAG